MPRITIVDNEYATLWFYPETKFLHHQIHKFMPAGVFRELLTAGAEYLSSRWDEERHEK